MSDACGNFISDKFKTFFKEPEHRASSIVIPPFEQWTSRGIYQIYQADTQKCFDTKSDPHVDLLHIISTPLGSGLPSPATLLFNHPIRCIMPILTRLPTNQIMIKSITKH